MTTDAEVLRIAKKLAVVQGVGLEDVVVPPGVATAYRELERTRDTARAVLGGDRVAADRFVAAVGGDASRSGTSRAGSRPLGAAATALLGMAREGPVEGLPCSGRIGGDLELLQGAFLLDAERRNEDGRLTTRTVEYIRDRRGELASFERRFDASMGIDRRQPVGDALTFGVGTDRMGSRMPSGGIGLGGPEPLPDEDDVPGRGHLPGRDSSPLFPPDHDLPSGTDISDPGVDPDLCLQVSDLCIELFQEFALASLADSINQLIASVDPACLCADDVDDTMEFTARPDGDSQFPPERGEYQLVFRGEDITDRIVDWTTDRITFTIPADAESGYVYLRRFVNSPSTGLGRTLGNLCGIPNVGKAGQPLSPSPRALISIVHPPVIESFTIEESDDESVTTEACTAVEFAWEVRLADQDVGQLLPPCTEIQVSISDGDGTVVTTSIDPVGTALYNPDEDASYRLTATSLADGDACGQDRSETIDSIREHRLVLEEDDPSPPVVVAGRQGTFTVRLSCPAPVDGATVELESSDRDILSLPESVVVHPGERSAVVQFGTDEDHHGEVTITASLADHQSATIRYQVLENLTAIVLSGGGAKGSFEVGALLYLREVWHDIEPSIVCGTSVGAINALALAETTTDASVDKIEEIWLALEYDSDMYVPSPEVQAASNELGIPIADVLVHGAGVPGIGEAYLNLVEVTPETAAWAAAGLVAGGAFGAIAAGLIQVFGDEPVDKVSDAMAELANASYLLDLGPTRSQLSANIDRNAVATSGMQLRLATVALEDGELYYVTEEGRLLRDRATDSEFDEPT